MTSARGRNRIAEALQYLRSHGQFFEFDNQERVVRASVSGVTNADDAAEHLGNLRDLQKLTFYAPGITDRGLAHLAGLTGLKELTINGSGFTSKGLVHLGGLPQLAYLYFNDARHFDSATFAEIARVASLQELCLNGGSFSDTDLAPLATLINLERLSLAGNHNAHGIFGNHLIGSSNLRTLHPGEQITDEGLSSIASLSALVRLDVGGPFTDTGLSHLVALQCLERLTIRSDHVTADGIAVVSGLPRLKSLWLDTPRLTDASIAALLRCSTLEDLSFAGSALSVAGLQELRDGLPRCGVCDMQRDSWPPESVNDQDAKRLRLESDTPFEVLLTEACDFDLVNGTFLKIGAPYNHSVDASQYTPEERVIMLVWYSSGIIGNGGFEYLFSAKFPGDPDFHVTAEAYRTAEIERSYGAFQAAFRLFPGGIVPHDPDERCRMYEAASKSTREGLNRAVWQDDRVRARKLAEFIRENAARLEGLDAG